MGKARISPIAYRVYIFDPSGEAAPQLAFSHEDLRHCKRWVRRWQDDPQGHAAVIWPVGAREPIHVEARKAVSHGA